MILDTFDCTHRPSAPQYLLAARTAAVEDQGPACCAACVGACVCDRECTFVCPLGGGGSARGGPVHCPGHPTQAQFFNVGPGFPLDLFGYQGLILPALRVDPRSFVLFCLYALSLHNTVTKDCPWFVLLTCTTTLATRNRVKNRDWEGCNVGQAVGDLLHSMALWFGE